jgi:pyrroline-5-carboxylate reductase
MTTFAPESARTIIERAGTIVLVGVGKIGGALLEGWQNWGIDLKNIIAIQPRPSRNLLALADKGLQLNPANKIAEEIGSIFIAVKPQQATEVVPTLATYIGSRTVVASILVGRTFGFLEPLLPRNTAIVRAIPNTAASVKRAITVAIANKHVTSQQRDIVYALFSTIGLVEWIADEKLMDAAAAISGSGTAYVFLFTEMLAQAGVKAGLPIELSTKLARAVVSGSGELLHRSTLDLQTLRQAVTSPGGTTAAALQVFESKNAFRRLMEEAIAAATKRSRELQC